MEVSSFLGFLGFARALFALSLPELVPTETAEQAVGEELLHLVVDLDSLEGFVDLRKREQSLGLVLRLRLGVLNHFLGGVVDLALLGLVLVAGVQHDLRLELLESVHVRLQSFLSAVLAAVVDRDSDGAGKAGGEACLAQLSEREAAAQTKLGVVLAGGGAHNGTESVRGAWI